MECVIGTDGIWRTEREAEVGILERKRYNSVPHTFFCLSSQRHSTRYQNNDEMITQLAMMGGGSGSNSNNNGGGGGGVSRISHGGLTLHRSNSSLELPHSPERSGRAVEAQPLRREYGSHGSIDVVAGQCHPAAAGDITTSDNIFAMLQDFRSGRASADRPHHPHHGDSMSGGLNAGISTDEVCGPTLASSPKLRLKLNRLWGGKENNCIPGGSTPGTVISSDLEERNRRRAFVHYDTQSLTANLGYAAKLRGILLARRRNTATGASAASTMRSPTPDNDTAEIGGSSVGDFKDDAGDGKGNDLLESCPFFRNEIGGEGEREVALTRSPGINAGAHRPSLAYGVSVLEPAVGENLWKHTCPLRKRLLPIESVDEGARYYRKYFLGKEHQNWFGMDEQLGPVAISIRKDNAHYRIIVRTSELLTLRGSVPEEALGLRAHQANRLPTRELLELVAPEVQVGCLRLGTQAAEEALARLDEQGLSNRYKVGVLYCRTGQRTEEEMYNNQHAGPAFLEFLDTIGQRIRLRGFEGYKAGLDTRTDSTGTHAVAANHRGAQVTLHVVTMLPFTPNNRQQLLRKRHIGNDIVTIVFQEPGALPFSPRRIRSQFQHVFIIVRAINPCTENTQYSVAVSRSKEVPIFGPPVPSGATFNKGKSFADFILAKVINAENAAHRSEKFSTMATRTRQEYLKDLAINYSTTTLIDTGQKFSMLSFSSKKKTPVRPRLACDSSQRGAICWQVILEESNQNTDCYLGISIETIVLIEEHSRQVIFVSPCENVLGWHAQTNSLRLYYHQGECISIHVRPDFSERDEIMEIVARLRAVTQGSPASELSLRRNSLGQLGFHVQPDGVVTQVENMGLSWQAGLRQGSRLVEICKVAVSTLSHDQMVDLLKTSVQVTVTVIPPTSDGQARRGCSLQSCQYLSSNYESDYENVSNNSENAASQQMAQQVQQTKNYERSMSPPRSSNSSGYGTGSSSRSFNDARFQQDVNPILNTNVSHGATVDERWYDLFESSEQDPNRRVDGTPPPPLPARQKGEPIPHVDTNAAKHFHHDYHLKESNYVSSRVIQEGSHKRLDECNRNSILEDSTSNYARIQKDNQSNWYGASQPHQKLSSTSSLTVNQTPNYSMNKSVVNGNTIRYNEYESFNGTNDQQNTIYDNDISHISQRKPKSDYETRRKENYESAMTHEQQEANNRLRDKRVNTHEFIQESYEKKINESRNHESSLQRNDGQNGEIIADTFREPVHEFIIGEKVTCIKNNVQERVLTRKVSHTEYARSKEHVTASLPPEMRMFEGNNGMVDATTLMSEDELSINCENISPALRRAVKQRSGSNNGGNASGASNASSRNQSPRPKSVVRNSHRNSANLTSSTLQEDLMKLINPDFIADDSNQTVINNRNDGIINSDNSNDNSEINMVNIVEKMNECSNKAANNNVNNNNINNTNSNMNKLEIQNRCRSRENLCGTSTTTLSVLSTNSRQDDAGNTNGSEVILTMARPATVISNASTNSSPAPSENKMSKEERLSPRVTKTPLVPLKSASNVITMNRESKIESENDSDCWRNSCHGDSINSRIAKQHNKQLDRTDERIYEEANSMTDLHGHLSNLELRVARETRRRLSLEDEVRRLRDENRRLQDENHAAAQQLRRFTEWFFQTIDHQ